MVSRDAMPDTPRQYTQRILGFVIGKEPLSAQREASKALASLIKPPRVSIETFNAPRESNLRMLRALPQHLGENGGMHSERCQESLADMVRKYAGHELNHLAQVEKMVQASEG
jgi:hypothetical protein